MTEKSQRAPNGKAPSHTGGPALRNRTVISEKEVSDPGASAVTSLESRGRPDETPPWTIASGSADPGPGDVSDLGDRYSKQFGIPAERIIVSKTLLTGILGVGSKTVDAWSRDALGLPCLVGQQNPRVDWVDDIKQVIEWVRDRAYRNGVADGSSTSPGSGLTVDPETGEARDLPDHLMSKDEAQPQIAIIDLKERRRATAPQNINDFVALRKPRLVGRGCSQLQSRREERQQYASSRVHHQKVSAVDIDALFAAKK